MKLNRTQKRLLWVLKKHGEKHPYAALYTWAIINRVYGQPPLFDSVPSLAQLFRQAVIVSPGPPYGPGPEALLPEMARWSVGYARAVTEQQEWADTDCAKMIPALYRWVVRELENVGWADRQDRSLPWTRYEFARVAPGPAFLSTLSNLANEWRYLCDWYRQARPDLGRYPTWRYAKMEADAWHEQLERSSVRVEQGPVVFRWPDGWTVQALTNADMFREEGRALGHCIGGAEYYRAYANEEAIYLSLRTPAGMPWFSFEVEPPAHRAMRMPLTDPRVVQIKGCKNRLPGMAVSSRDCPRPDPTECTRVWQFLRETPWLVGRDYAACWGYTAATLGLPPQVQQRSPANYRAEQLVRPPSAVDVPDGEATDRLHPTWWRG